MSFNRRVIKERADDRHTSQVLVRQSIVLDARALSERLAKHRLSRSQIYEGVGHYCLESLKQQYDLNARSPGHVYGGMKAGVNKMVRWLAISPEAYQSYSHKNGQSASLAGIQESLKSKTSLQTILKFMRLTLESELDTQRGLGLASIIPATRLNGFSFAEVEGQVGFVVDADRFSELTTPMKYARTTELTKGDQQCPGQGLVLGRIWPAMVDLAVDTPEVFPAHIAELQLERAA